jgi:hypothetical protein
MMSVVYDNGHHHFAPGQIAQLVVHANGHPDQIRCRRILDAVLQTQLLSERGGDGGVGEYIGGVEREGLRRGGNEEGGGEGRGGQGSEEGGGRREEGGGAAAAAAAAAAAQWRQLFPTAALTSCWWCWVVE